MIRTTIVQKRGLFSRSVCQADQSVRKRIEGEYTGFHSIHSQEDAPPTLRVGLADRPTKNGKPLGLLSCCVPIFLFCILPLAAARPNVVIIMADDLGYSDLGCYGGEIRTPNIDTLAADGVRFTGFKNTCRCAPSRASLLAGRYQHAVGVGRMTQADRGPGYRGQLSKTAPTLAEILSANNYPTGIVGKWHLSLVTDEEKRKGSFPCDRGFDFFHGTWWGAKSFFSPEYMMKNHEHLENGNYPKDYYLTTDLSKSAIDFVKSQKADKPFFLYLAHYAPHKPIQAPKERVEKCRERYRVGFEKLQKARFARQQKLGAVLLLRPRARCGMNENDYRRADGLQLVARRLIRQAAAAVIATAAAAAAAIVTAASTQQDVGALVLSRASAVFCSS